VKIIPELSATLRTCSRL